MNREELDSVIRRPASLRNVSFEEGLAERILNDAGVKPSTLPLLEFALTELWVSDGTYAYAFALITKTRIPGTGGVKYKLDWRDAASCVRLAVESGRS
jgi:conflict system STAND superfamily ATPase